MIMEWGFVALVILGLLYTMIVVKQEKRAYEENSVAKRVGNLLFPIPSWWGVIAEEENKLVFERTDTRYDWRAEYLWQFPIPNKTIEEQMRDFIQSQNILFDPDSTVIQTPQHYLTHKEVTDGRCSVVRIEGTATENEIDRIYYDAFIIRDHQSNGFVLATSKSSVLNGLIEGPYFEATLQDFKRAEA